MILIFGGTTEGRMAVEVCEEAGKPFYYSTKSAQQQVELHHGIRQSGAMTAQEMKLFCRDKDIACIVDAAHPFAENLHRAIAESGWPVVRLQRPFGQRRTDVTYCKDYVEAMDRMQQAGVERLLALSGANTIRKLKPFWKEHHTIFRILDREESFSLAQQEGFPCSQLVLYPEQMPSYEEERELMLVAGCDAMITKESGQTGGFDMKVNAAMEAGMKVFVVEAPSLPPAQGTRLMATGRHTLRRAIQQLVPSFFPLRTGLTTGACATAAAKAALLSLLDDELPEEVSFALPDGETLAVGVECQQPGMATVVKDSSDDPDVLKGCRVTASVKPNDTREIRFLRGEGVGVVTLPGLGIPVGGPAINPTPRKMISEEFRALTADGYDVTISVEGGEELAHHTFNPKVGVVDGISIIGTSGIVSPLSNEAFVESIGRELEVAKAIGCTAIGFASGKNGEDALRAIEPSLRVIHYGNFVGEALKRAHQLGFQRVVLGIMIGKAVKLAEGHLDTHSHKVTTDLSKWGVTMARELWELMPPAFFQDIEEKCLHHCRAVFPTGELEVKLIRG